MPLLEQYQDSIPSWPSYPADASVNHDGPAVANRDTTNSLIPNVLVVDDDATAGRRELLHESAARTQVPRRVHVLGERASRVFGVRHERRVE